MNDKLAVIGGFKTEHRGLIDVKVPIFNNLISFGVCIVPFGLSVVLFSVIIGPNQMQERNKY